MSYSKIVTDLQHDIAQAKKGHKARSHLYEQRRQTMNAQLRKERRFTKLKMPFSRVCKWLKGWG